MTGTRCDHSNNGLVYFLGILGLAVLSWPATLLFAEQTGHAADGHTVLFTSRDEVLVIAFCVAGFVLVIWPLGRFLMKDWPYRKKKISSLLAGEAIVFYYRQFRPCAPVLQKNKELVKLAFESGQQIPPTLCEEFLHSFEIDFDRRYGRRYYAAPITILTILTLISAFWTYRVLKSWIESGTGPGETLRALVAAALAGAFVWIISDEIDRLRRHDFSTSDVYYYVFRILLAIPFAWAIAAVSADGKPLGLPGSIPLAFFLGAFPTNTLFTIARRVASQQLKLGDDQQTGRLDLEDLQSIGKPNAERFKDEGISTISALAYADPIDLTIRTNFDFNYVVDCVSQALAWIYFEKRTSALFDLSMRGAQEIISITKDADDHTDKDKQRMAHEAIKAGAATLNISEGAFRSTLNQIASDPYARFLWNVWR
jgi:hypothetical protein